jgi:hypothetical protein
MEVLRKEDILKKERGNPWRKRVIAFEIDKDYAVEYPSKETVRSIISRDILDRYPEMVFTTKKAEALVDDHITKYLKVRRVQ